jgi:hypothetical protein
LLSARNSAEQDHHDQQPLAERDGDRGRSGRRAPARTQAIVNTSTMTMRFKTPSTRLQLDTPPPERQS